MRILIIEDEHKIAQAIKRGLEQERWAADIAYDGEEGFDLAVGEEYDAIVLDLMLPKMDGLTLCKKLRGEENIHTPIIILTAKGQTEDKVEGLNCGADDYLAKPFAFAELVARLRALMRRPKKTAGQVLSCDNLTVDPVNFEVKRKGEPIILSKKEFALLEYMIRHAGQILTREQIINHVWNYEADILPNNVEVYMGYLRRKIDQAFKGETPLIRTVRGFGYRLYNPDV